MAPRKLVGISHSLQASTHQTSLHQAMGAARLLSSRWRTHLGVSALIGASTSYGFSANCHKIRCDSTRSASWPQNSALTTQSRDASTASRESGAESSKKGDAKTTLDPHNDSGPIFEDEDTSSWFAFSSNLETAKQSLSSVNWSAIGDGLTDYIVPTWARQIPDNISKLQRELSMAPGSLADEIWEEAHDVDINPEIMWDARVRVSNDLCSEERAFQKKRKVNT